MSSGRRIGGLRANEVRLFGFVCAYGCFIALVYWYVTDDVIGTVLLGGFGLATGAGFGFLWQGTRNETAAPSDVGLIAEGPLADTDSPLPTRSIAPLWIGLGLALAGLGLVYGVWFVVAALLPIGLGAADWLLSAGREIALLHSGPHGDDREE